MPTVEVKTTSGTVRGEAADGVARFLGIPYAEAPLGPNRFRPAVPYPSWDGVRDALALGPTAPKPGYPAGFAELLPEPVVAGDEFLNVNVWAPEGASGRPVMVWIHGGAFVNGSNAIPVYDGTAFARDGVVLVSINYRLGAEGFLLLPGGTANLGLLDQVAALRWVQENVAAFGGDPDAVTIFGESAGGMSVGSLLAMPVARGLFRRAILQSGAGQHAMSVGTAASIAGLVADTAGVPVEHLVDVEPERLVAVQNELSAQMRLAPDPARFGDAARNGMIYHPVVDGDVLPQLPLSAIANGSAGDVDVMVGTTRDEMRLFFVAGGMKEGITEAALPAMSGAYGLPDDAVERYRAVHPDGVAWQVAADIAGDWFFRIPAVRLAEARGRAHVYEFERATPVLDGALGSCHALELGFVFDTLSAGSAMGGPDAPQELADAVHAAWVAFATSGDPGWEPYGAERRVRRFGATVETVSDPRGDLRELWEGIR